MKRGADEALGVLSYNYKIDGFVLPYPLNWTDICIKTHLFAEFDDGGGISLHFVTRRTYRTEKCAIDGIGKGIDSGLRQCISGFEEVVKACI